MAEIGPKKLQTSDQGLTKRFLATATSRKTNYDAYCSVPTVIVFQDVGPGTAKTNRISATPCSSMALFGMGGVPATPFGTAGTQYNVGAAVGLNSPSPVLFNIIRV